MVQHCISVFNEATSRLSSIQLVEAAGSTATVDCHSRYNNAISPVKPKRANHHPSIRIYFFADWFTVTVAMEDYAFAGLDQSDGIYTV